MLRAENIHYKVDKPLIKSIYLSFEKGKLYGILGPNGSGKSTLLKTLAGIWKPTEGKVWWKDRDLLSSDRKIISQTISLVPQNPQVQFEFSAAEMVAMGRYPHERKTCNDIIHDALKKVDVWELRNRPITQLSQGEKQRVYIARALVTESPVLLLDEPTAALDVRHQLEIWALLEELKENGKIVIVATHDLVSAERHCDEVAVMKQGTCEASGKLIDILDDERLYSIFGVRSTKETGVFAL